MPPIDPRLAAINDCLYRVSIKAIIIQDTKLLTVIEPEGWHGLPGGGLDYGEEISEALTRELAEEIGLPTNGIHCNVIPEIITTKSVVDNIPRLNICYRVSIDAPVQDRELQTHWLSTDDLDTARLGPSLQQAKDHIKHLLAQAS